MSNPTGTDPNAQPDLASQLRTESSSRSGDPSRAPGNPAAVSQDKIQDMEKSLVERIADVDDERRRTSTQVRSALLTHREEVDARLSTFRHILLGMLALLLALTVAVVWLALDPRQGSDADPASPALAQQMSTLAERVDGIDGRVAGLDARSAAQAASQSARTDPAAGLSGEIDAMQQRMQTLEARIAALAKQVEDGAAGPTGAQAGQPDRSAAERLPVDRLIDVQLARLEQEYQRLAQKVASPAVASASSASDAELLPLAEDAEAEPRAASAAGAPATGTAAEGTAPADASDEPVVLDEPAMIARFGAEAVAPCTPPLGRAAR